MENLLEYGYEVIRHGTILIVITVVLKKIITYLFGYMENEMGFSAEQIANQILYRSGIEEAKVSMEYWKENTHYNTKNKELILAHSIYHKSTISAIGMAAHEAGHAIQCEKHGLLLKIRNGFGPCIRLIATASVVVTSIGSLVYQRNPIIMQIGFMMFAVAILFEFVTLPIELIATWKAFAKVKEMEVLTTKELIAVAVVMFISSFAYIAALFGVFIIYWKIITSVAKMKSDD